MTVTQGPDSSPLVTAAVAELVDRSDERDRYLARILAAGREAWDRCWPVASAAGRQAEAAERDRLWAEAARPVARIRPGETELARWRLRGEDRTRATFAAPHPGDYEGGPVQPW